MKEVQAEEYLEGTEFLNNMFAKFIETRKKKRGNGVVYDIRKNTEKGPWEYRDSKGNILQVEDSGIDLESQESQDLLEVVGYRGPGDWESA